MSQTLEQVALRVAADVFGPATDHQSCQFMSAIVAYSEALIAALGAQEPIAQVDMNKASCVHWLNSTDPDTFHGTKLYAAPVLPQQQQKLGITAEIDLPHDLHEETKWLVINFAEALAKKLAHAQRKYGYTDGWRDTDWIEECKAKLLEHLGKGDPRDVAAYCAFLWYHHASTKSVLPPEGWQMVPKEPTVAMLRAAVAARHDSVITMNPIYQAMLAAAPKPEDV